MRGDAGDGLLHERGGRQACGVGRAELGRVREEKGKGWAAGERAGWAGKRGGLRVGPG